MTRRITVAVLAAAVLVLCVAAPAQARTISFVDKQVQAGGLLIQNYINKYGVQHKFTFPAPSMVKNGGGLPDSTLMWPANPWTGKVMGPGKAKGTYTYTLGAGNISYRLVMHFSSGNYAFKGSMPGWLKRERDTASLQNLFLLQRYVEAYARDHGGTYPADLSTTTLPPESYFWPVNPWTGAAMAPTSSLTALGDFSYTQTAGGTGYTLKVVLSSGSWSTPVLHQILLLTPLTTTPGG